jgi:4-amino-4-deoxy-L-arabinose transferase-like glycosyltransferase
MGSVRKRLTEWSRPGRVVGTPEARLLAAAIALGMAVRVVYVLLTQHYALAGDAPEYDAEGWFIAHGHLFWTRTPYGIAHASAWKAPAYPAWVGLWYTLVGHHPTFVRFAQVPLGAVTILLSWILARRLFGLRVAAAAAFLVALYPLAWQYEELLYPESLATPLMLGLLLVILTRAPTRRRALLLGVLLGLSTLVRPNTPFVLLAALVAWCIATGWRRGVGLTVLAALVAVVVLAPWTVRNAVVLHGFLPVSMQDAALYGTFNPQSASDPVFPYAWRADPASVADLYDRRHPRSDLKLRSQLIHRATDYISAHPASLAKAFFWNGLSRLWDIRHRSHALVEVRFEGRSKLVANLGLDAYLVLLPLSLVGLWRLRRRRALVLSVLALALGASIVFTTDSGTRYREPFEPLIAVLACVGVLGALSPTAAAAGRVRGEAAKPATADRLVST